MSSDKSTNRFFVEKLGDSNPSEFVGDAGELFYDPTEGDLRLSDGEIEGGIPATQSIVDGFGFIPEDGKLYKNVGLNSNTEYGNIYADYQVGNHEIIIGQGSEVIFDRFNHLDDISADSIQTSGINVDGISNLGFLQPRQTVVGNITLGENTEYYSFSQEMIIDPYVEIVVGSGSTVTMDKLSQIEGTGGGGGTSSQWVTTNAGIHTLSNVGIGTTNPFTNLQVNGDVVISAGVDTTKYISIKAYEENGGSLSFEGTQGQLFSITNNLSSGSIFNINDINGDPILDANANGKLGIGTTNPTEKLTVVGDARVTGILTVGTASITLDGSNNTIYVGTGVTLYGDSGDVYVNGEKVQPLNSTVDINTTGIITASSFVGNLTGTATTSTNVIGGIGSLSQIIISGVSTLGGVRITSTGIITSSNPGVSTVVYYGDGSNLIGVNAFNVITQTSTSSPVYPTFANSTGVTSVGISTLQLSFIPVSGFLGIGTTNPTTRLQIRGVLGFGPGNNIRIGDSTTGCSITSGTNNFFAGVGAGRSNTTGFSNNFLGIFAGCSNTVGGYNNFLGCYSGYNNTTGCFNNFFGLRSGYSNTSGCGNNFFGSDAGSSNTTGNNNFFSGASAGLLNTTANNNIFIGNISGYNNTTGSSNVFLGNQTGLGNIVGSCNNFVGQYAGYSNTSGSNNNFLGASAGFANTTGRDNNFFGACAGCTNTTGRYNNFFGCKSGFSNTTGATNNFIGKETGYSNTTGYGNNFFGNCPGYLNTTGINNNFFGNSAGFSNTTGSSNNFFGPSAGYSNTSGSSNNFFGTCAGRSNTTGSYNNFFGCCAGRYNTTGCFNNFFGRYAGQFNTIGCNNNFLGNRAGCANTTGSNNNFFGRYAGCTNTTGSFNVVIGDNRTSTPILNGSNQLVIGAGSTDWIIGNSSYFVGIGTTNPTTRLQVVGDVLVSGVVTASSFIGNLTGTATTATNVIGGIGSISQLSVSGISTFTNGPVLVGSGTSTGTASQPLQVTGGAYVSGNLGIGTTNPTSKLSVVGNANIVGVVTATAFYGNGSNLTGISGAIIACCNSNFITCNTSLPNITTGGCNNFFGPFAGYSNTTGTDNSFFGYQSGSYNTTGSHNTFFHDQSGRYNTIGSHNNFLGQSAGRGNTSGNYNNFFGNAAGLSNNTGSSNNFFGYKSGLSNTTGSSNNFFGAYSGCFNTTGGSNNFLGICAGLNNTTGGSNNFFGYQSGRFNTTGTDNNFFGYQSGRFNTTGCSNNFLGRYAGYGNTTGSNNIALGTNSGNDAVYSFTSSPASNIIVLGNDSHTAAYIKTNWTVTSDERDKTNIQPIGIGLNFVEQLNPIQYQWKDRETGEITHEKPRYGFLAQDIQKLETDPKVIVDETDPENLKLSESMIVPVLVNAIKELNQKVQELSVELQELKLRIKE